MTTQFPAPHYLVRRKVLKLVGGAFHIWDSNGILVAFSEQKAFKLREDIRIYSDESKTTEIMSIAARNIIDFSASYDVTDTVSGERVGSLRRHGGRSILRDEWTVFDGAGSQVATLVEDSMVLALLRRFFTGLIPQRYDVFMPDHKVGRKAASLDQAFNPFVYKLDVDFTFDPQHSFDRRLGIAAAILLAAVEGRQS